MNKQINIVLQTFVVKHVRVQMNELICMRLYVCDYVNVCASIGVRVRANVCFTCHPDLQLHIKIEETEQVLAESGDVRQQQLGAMPFCPSCLYTAPVGNQDHSPPTKHNSFDIHSKTI